MATLRHRVLIRAATTAAERRAALALLDAEWPGESEWFRLELNAPHFQPDQFLVAMHGSDVVGHVQVAPPRDMRYGQATMSVGGLHGLVVAEAWRGRGIGRQLVAAAHAQLLADGAVAAVVFATEPEFYIPHGYGPALPLYSATIEAGAAARVAHPLTFRTSRADELPAIAAVYDAFAPTGAIGAFTRTVADWHWLSDLFTQTERSRLRPFFGRERQLLVPAAADSKLGYVWMGRDDSRLWIFEAACPDEAAPQWLAALGARALIRGLRELAVTVPPTHPLAQAIYRHGGRLIQRHGPGMVCILDWPRLAAQISPELNARLGADGVRLLPPVKGVMQPVRPSSAPVATLLPARLSGHEKAAPATYTASPQQWAQLVFGQVAANASLPPALRLLFPPATPHIWPADNRF